MEDIIVDNTVFNDPIVYDNYPQKTIDKKQAYSMNGIELCLVNTHFCIKVFKLRMSEQRAFGGHVFVRKTAITNGHLNNKRKTKKDSYRFMFTYSKHDV